MIPCAACGTVPVFIETLSGSSPSIIERHRGSCPCGAWTCRAGFVDGRRSFEWAWGAAGRLSLVRLSEAFDERGDLEDRGFLGGLMIVTLEQRGGYGALWRGADPAEAEDWDLVGLLTAYRVMSS